MNKKQSKHLRHQRQRRSHRVRTQVSGTADRPRLAVHKSLRQLTAQLIDDAAGVTLASVKQSDLKEQGKPVELATLLGKSMAEKAKEKGISSVVFDRRHYQYHGRVKAFADGAREGGLTF